MKKSFTLAVGAALALSLSACGGSGTTNTTAETTVTNDDLAIGETNDTFANETVANDAAPIDENAADAVTTNGATGGNAL